MKKIFLWGCILTLIAFASSCKKDINQTNEPVITSDSINVIYNQAVFRWSVEFPGKMSSVVMIGTREDMSDAVSYGSEEASESKVYEVTATGLMESSTYYYYYKIWNPSYSFDTEIKSFDTPHLSWPKVLTLSAVVNKDLVATVKCQLVDLGGDSNLKTGVCWSKKQNPTLDDEYKEANSNYPNPYQVTLDNLTADSVYYVRAYATNGMGTSYGDEICFICTQPAPEGAASGLFSINPVKRVYISKGNLQYQASTNTWRFAEHQWETMGPDNSNIASDYSGWIDLFGWGTSGWNNGNTYYQPWDNPGNESDYSLYGPVGQQNLVFANANADWGVYNPISNGGNQAGLWRTPTELEWNYLMAGRDASSINGVENARYAKALVNGVVGLIIFPDRYFHPSGVAMPTAINIDATPEGWISNNYTEEDWTKMENAGAVFLPAEGYRKNKYLYNDPLKGGYWSTTCNNNIGALALGFQADKIVIDQSYYYYRAVGECVRLIQEKK